MHKFTPLIIAAVASCLPTLASAALLDFSDSSNLGTGETVVTLGGSMSWSATGGGHLYTDDYNDDDFLNFSSATYINQFQMNAMAWQGFNKGAIGLIDIEAKDENNAILWSQTVDLSDYTDWNNWLTISVETAGITQLAFLAPGTIPHINGFWPSIDNMVINEVPVPASFWLLASGLIGLMSKQRFQRRD